MTVGEVSTTTRMVWDDLYSYHRMEFERFNGSGERLLARTGGESSWLKELAGDLEGRARFHLAAPELLGPQLDNGE